MSKIDKEKYERIKEKFGYAIYRRRNFKDLNFTLDGEIVKEVTLEVYGVSSRFGVADIVFWVKKNDEYQSIFVYRCGTEEALRIRDKIRTEEELTEFLYDKARTARPFFLL